MSMLNISAGAYQPLPTEIYEIGVLLKAVMWDDQQTALQFCAANNCQIVLWRGNDQGIPPAYGVIRQGDNYYVFLGGTANVQHWRNHLTGISPVRDPNSGVQWNGMWYRIARDNLAEINDYIPPLTANGRVWFIGYSYGAALSTIFADDYVRFYGQAHVGLVTFGGPRSHLATPSINEPAFHFRIVNHGDIVADLPPRQTNWLLAPSLYGANGEVNWLHWEHSGERWELRANGDFLETPLSAVNSSYNLGNWSSAYANHDFDEYLRRLRQKLINNGQWQFMGQLPVWSAQINNNGEPQVPIQAINRLNFSDLQNLNQLSTPQDLNRITADNWPDVVIGSDDSPAVPNSSQYNSLTINTRSLGMLECTILMETPSADGVWGASESHFLSAGTSLVDAEIKLRSLANKRRKLFGNLGSGGTPAAANGEGTTNIYALRIQDTEIDRDGKIIYMTGAASRNTAGYVDYFSSFGERRLLHKMRTNDGSRCYTYLFGCPDVYFTRAGSFVVDGVTGGAQWHTSFDQYCQELLNNSWGGRVRADSTAVVFTTATFANNLWTISRVAHGLSVGDKLTFHRIKYPKSWMGKICEVVDVEDDTFTVTGLGGDASFVAPGFYRPLSYTWSQYAQVDPLESCKPTKRNTGGAWAKKSGRAANRASS